MEVKIKINLGQSIDNTFRTHAEDLHIESYSNDSIKIKIGNSPFYFVDPNELIRAVNNAKNY